MPSKIEHYKKIYSQQADKYHRMIAFEDEEGNLRPAMEKIATFTGKKVLDLGSGTGRFPHLFPEADFTCLDLHADMLRENWEQRNTSGGTWDLIQGDMRFLPIQNQSFDIATAGWALGHFPRWYSPDGEDQINLVLEGMHRVVNPKGAILILETLSTGSLTPAPPTEALAAYYTHLEENWGFTRQEVRTDYLFENLEDAVHATEFFFGEELAEKIRANNWVRPPEWSGVWGKIV